MIHYSMSRNTHEICAIKTVIILLQYSSSLGGNCEANVLSFLQRKRCRATSREWSSSSKGESKNGSTDQDDYATDRNIGRAGTLGSQYDARVSQREASWTDCFSGRELLERPRFGKQSCRGRKSAWRTQ